MFHLSHGPRSSRCSLAARIAWLALAASTFGCQSSGSDAEEPTATSGADAESKPAPSLAAVTPPASAAAADNRPAAAAPAAAPAPPVEREMTGSEAAANSAPVARPTATFAACLDTGGAYSDCNTLYITMAQASPSRCVQLTLDDCGGYGGSRRGLSADVPGSWRLASGSVGSSSTPCELGVFYPGNAIVNDASGSVSWDETTRQPSKLELKLTLEPSGTTASTGSPASIDIATYEPLNPGPCED